jgi:hypothetical protein
MDTPTRHPHRAGVGCHIIAFNPINDVTADLPQPALPEMERAPAVLVIIASHHTAQPDPPGDPTPTPVRVLGDSVSSRGIACAIRPFF